MSEGLSAVLSRISQIESLITPSAASTSAASSTSGAEFEDVLGQATNDSGGSDSGVDTSGSAGAAGGTGVLGDAAISIASRYLGTPYRWGGTDPKTGLDCSGFTQLVYKQLGVNLPRTSSAQAQTGTAVASLSQAQRGDLLFFGSPVHHVGIYLGDGKMIDAPHTGSAVKIQSVYETPSQIRRVLPTTAGSLAVQSTSSSSSSLLAGLGSTSTGALGNTPYAALFTAAGQRYGVDPALLSAVAKAESGYHADAVSPAGAQGLMQLMPATARSLGVDPTNPAQAVDGAARLLANNLRSFNGRVDLALAAYNAGPAAVRKYNGVPPFSETQNYVQRVQTYWGQLR